MKFESLFIKCSEKPLIFYSQFVILKKILNIYDRCDENYPNTASVTRESGCCDPTSDDSVSTFGAVSVMRFTASVQEAELSAIWVAPRNLSSQNG